MIYDPADPDCHNEELLHGLIPGTLIEEIFDYAIVSNKYRPYTKNKADS
jgi:hypothetical protein